MKKLISMMLVLSMVLCMVACGSSDKKDNQNSDNKSENPTSTVVSGENKSNESETVSDSKTSNTDASNGNTEASETNISDSETNTLDSDADNSDVKATDNENELESSDNSVEEASTEFILDYPDDMKALGYTEALVLENKPERVVSLSAAPVLALYELGVNLVGVPNSRVVKWPEDLASNAATVSFSVMSPEDFDYESVVALEPDLVLLAMNGADSAGAKLESLGIPVYYIYAGHTVPYSSIKMQTEKLVEAFDNGNGAGERLMSAFSEIEKEVEIVRNAFSGTKIMALQSGSSEMHYIQTNAGTLGSMLDMIGFENVYENDAASMVQLDYEQALDYAPDYVVCVGGTDAATHQTVMEEAFLANPDYWNAIDAIAEGRIVYVDVTYCSTAGINVIDNIAGLIEIMSEATGISVNY